MAHAIAPTEPHAIVPVAVDHLAVDAELIKQEAEHDENVKAKRELHNVEDEYTGGDDVQPRTGWRKMLRSNPDLEFMRDLAAANATVLDPAEVKRVNRKLWMLIVPCLFVNYMYYYIDKTTLQYAALFGIKKDLHLSGSDYSNLGSIFYVGWLVWAIPGNLLLAKFPLNYFLAVNIFLWGVFLMAQAGSQSYGAMLGLRFVSGMFEAVADPAFVALSGMWFTRKQVPLVIGMWYSANGVGIALGGLIGYGIGHMKGTSLAVWRYEFIIVGAACAAWAIIMAILVPEAPHKSRWLTRREGVVTMSRKRDDYHFVEKRQLSWAQVRETVMDIKIYLYFFLGFFANVPNGVTSNFGTLVVSGFGFSTFQTTLLQIPYGVFIMLMIFASIAANHYTHHLNIRTYLMAAVTCLTVLGFALMAFVHHTAAGLIGYFLTGSSNAVFVLALSLVSGNVGGTTKKVLATASIFVGVEVGNIVGPYSMVASEAPRYHTGIIVCMASRAAEIVVILLLRLCFAIPNRNRDKKFREGNEEYDPSVVVYADLTDKQNMHFRYTM